MAQSNILKNFTTTKYQVRTLPTDILVATTNISSLALNNLVIGRQYRLTMNMLAVSSDGTAQLIAIHNGAALLRTQVKAPALGNEDRVQSSCNLVFIATATTITFNYAEFDAANSQLDGNGTTEETFVMLEEVFNHQATTQWT